MSYFNKTFTADWLLFLILNTSLVILVADCKILKVALKCSTFTCNEALGLVVVLLLRHTM